MIFRDFPLPISIHRTGYVFIFVGVIITVILSFVHGILGLICSGITLYLAYFFRDPRRITLSREGLIVSPADGHICMITTVSPPPEYGVNQEKMIKISIFMSIFDCHVQRFPISGRIENIVYKPGRFFNAELDKASEHNERNAIIMRSGEGKYVVVIQIAGLIARRIECWAQEAHDVLVGDRFGIIRFGSRVDVYIPEDAMTFVAIGQKMVSGETILADLYGRADKDTRPILRYS